MSYCRWSKGSDIYAYHNTMGHYSTNVARSRRVDEPDFPSLSVGTPQEWLAAYEVYKVELKKCPLVPIGLPHDGESFADDDIESFRDRLTSLRSLGYLVPEYAFEAIQDEIDNPEYDEPDDGYGGQSSPYDE